MTVGDFAVQAVVARRLAEQLPGSTLIGEESAEALRLEEGIATLDQVTQFVRRSIPDATPEEVCGLIDRGSRRARRPNSGRSTRSTARRAFLRRDQYAVALGKIENGVVTIGVLGCPELVESREPAQGGGGSLLLAVAGEGTLVATARRATATGSRCTFRSGPTPPTARVLRSVEKAHTNTDEIGRLAEHLGITAAPVPLDSQAKYAVLAAGAGDVLLAADLAEAAELQGKNLGPGGRVAGDHRSGRPDHRPRRQAARLFSRPHARERTAASWPRTARCTSRCSAGLRAIGA